MNISGFTFIKNGLSLGYPFKESIESIDPFCDEVIINVGFDDPLCRKDDGTYDYLREHFKGKRYVFLKNYWDPALSEGGKVLAQQTNIALSKCSGKYCQYIQGDEVLHANDYEKILSSVKAMEKDKRIQGLVYDYLHFYCNTDIVKRNRNAYRREVRLVRNGIGAYSHLDAQGFKAAGGSKLLCKLVGATVYHYGWARIFDVMEKKVESFSKLYHGKDFVDEDKFKYYRVWGLKKFEGDHPANMSDWIEKNKNDIDVLSLKSKFQLRFLSRWLSDLIENTTGHRVFEYRNYKLL